MKSDSANEPKNSQDDKHGPQGAMQTQSNTAEKQKNDYNQ